MSDLENFIKPRTGVSQMVMKNMDMSDYVNCDALPKEQALELQKAIDQKENIIIAGEAASGKTTFLNMLIGELNKSSPDDRLVVIEDTPELSKMSENCVPLLASKKESLEHLIVTSLRLSPHRIVLGEVRTGAVLLPLFQCWDTEYPGGLATIQANSAVDTLNRFQMLAREATGSNQSQLIHSAVDRIIVLTRTTDLPSVRQIVRVKDSQSWTPRLTANSRGI